MPNDIRKHIRSGSEVSMDLWEKMIQTEKDRAEGRLTNTEYVERLSRLASQEALERMRR